jgi:hypothetical protein
MGEEALVRYKFQVLPACLMRSMREQVWKEARPGFRGTVIDRERKGLRTRPAQPNVSDATLLGAV